MRAELVLTYYMRRPRPRERRAVAPRPLGEGDDVTGAGTGSGSLASSCKQNYHLLNMLGVL